MTDEHSPLSEAERLNLIAAAVTAGRGFVPLNVRYQAARAADVIVEAWFAVKAADAHIEAALNLGSTNPREATWPQPPVSCSPANNAAPQSPTP